ncbi:MAG: hypothetical protein ABI266_04920 [Ginsengibacter sp.]
MKKYYQDIVDEVFGCTYRHRTLRTLFDPDSSEWQETAIDEKVQILSKLIGSNKITIHEILRGYVHFYKYELAGKKHVLDSLQDGLGMLLAESILPSEKEKSLIK